MAYFHRRSFLERLSLGAGALVLSPMLNTIVSEARGATTARKRFIVFTFPNGGFWRTAKPKEVDAAKKEFGTDVYQLSDYTMPYMYEPLAAYRKKMLIVDGLVNQQLNFGHFALDLLTCCPKNKKGDGYGGAGGMSFDQHVAGVIGKNTPFRSIHLGAGTNGGGFDDNAKLMSPGLFAKGAGQPIPLQLNPMDAFNSIFPNGAPGKTTNEGPDLGAVERKQLLDYLAEDIKKARASLSPSEKYKLDEYLGSIEEAQKRLAGMKPPPGGCAQGGPSTPSSRYGEAVFPAQVDVGAAALACGMTNVLTISFLGIGKAFKSLFPNTEHPAGIDLHGVGHGMGNKDTPPSGDKMINWWAGQAARLINKLAAIREGDKSIFDNTVMLFANDNAESHHSRCWRYPVVLVGDAGGGLKADGRYVRYPTRSSGDEKPRSGPAGMRAIGDLMSTLGHALGAPVDDWGKNGLEAVKGPLPELLA